MKKIAILLSLIISVSAQISSYPDAISKFNFALGGEINIAAVVGKDSVLIGSRGQNTLYLYDIASGLSTPINLDITPYCGQTDCSLDDDVKILQKYNNHLYMVAQNGLFKSLDMGKTWDLVNSSIKREFVISDSTIFYYEGSGINTVIMSASIETPNVSKQLLKVSDYYPNQNYSEYAKIHAANGIFGFSYRYINDDSKWITGLVINDFLSGSSEFAHYKYPVEGMYIGDFYTLNSDTIVALTYGNTEVYGIKYLYTNSNTWEHKSTIFGQYLVSLSKTKYFVSDAGRTPLPMKIYDSKLDKIIQPTDNHNFSKKGFIKLDENRIFAFGKKNHIIIDYSNANDNSSVSISDANINYNYSSFNSVMDIDSDNIAFLNTRQIEIIKVNKNSGAVTDITSLFTNDDSYDNSFFISQKNIYHLFENEKKVAIYNLPNLTTTNITLNTDKTITRSLMVNNGNIYLIGYKESNNSIGTHLIEYDLQNNTLNEYDLEQGLLNNDWYQNHSKFQAGTDSVIFFSAIIRTYGNSGSDDYPILEDYLYNVNSKKLSKIERNVVVGTYGNIHYYSYNVSKIDSFYYFDKYNNSYGPDYRSKDLISWEEAVIEPFDYISGVSYFYNTKNYNLAFSTNTSKLFYKTGQIKWRELILGSSAIFVGNSGPLAVPPINESTTENNKIYVATNDGTLLIDLNKLPLNFSPIISSISTVTIIEDSSVAIILSATDADGDAIIYNGIADTSDVTVTASNDTLKLTPKADWHGTSVITAIASDGTASDSTTFTLTVTSVNDAPTLTKITEILSTNEETVLKVAFKGEDVDGDDLTYTYASDTSGVAATHNTAKDSLVLTSVTDFFGNAIITVTVSDASLSDTSSFTLNVININDAPVLSSIQNQTTNEDEVIVVKLTATDLDGDVLTYSGIADTSAVTVTASNDTLKLTPRADWNGTSVITAIALDGTTSDSTSFTLNVNPVQDAPYAFDWVSTALDTIDISQSNLADTYELKWSESEDVDGDTIDYLLYAKIGVLESEEIYDTTSTSVPITNQEFLENVFEPFPMLPRVTVKFSVVATDGIDTVKVTGDDRVLFVNRYDYLSTESEGVPTEFALHENYPNPFNPTTTLRFDLPEVSNITLTIFNMLGQKIRTYDMQSTPAGHHALKWNATNDYGDPVGAGVYLYQLQSKDFVKTRKMVLLK
ncbi:MAG: tandem-95 repeat protein [Candidatus Marinimicrobia bacterium]|nr:tandem-95 repeat protein [Candidatus Neomarinimicrobiota bacterium]